MEIVTFAAIRGQDEALALLARAIASGRVASTYLFTGPSGVGRRTTALALAAALNCPVGKGSACGECPSCHTIAHGVHPDVRVWQREEDKKIFPIDLVRKEIIPSLMLRPYRGRYKVAVIEEADSMNQEAYNCFLKTLEEPPPDTVLILLAANPQLLPETIVSRCQRVAFRPLSEELLVEFLVVDAGVDRAEAHLAALMAEGSLTAARGYLGGSWRELWESGIDLAMKITAGDQAALFHPLAAAATTRDEAEKVLLVLERIFRLALRRHLGLTAGMAQADQRMATLGGRFDRDGFIGVLEYLRNAQLLLRGNVNSRLVVEGLLLELGAAASQTVAAAGSGAKPPRSTYS